MNYPSNTPHLLYYIDPTDRNIVCELLCDLFIINTDK